MKHYLRDGQSYEELSAKYKVPVCMIARANELSKKTRKDISIPKRCYCNRCPAKAWTSFEMYVVQSTDSTAGLAKRFGISVEELSAMNAIDIQRGVKPGDVISVPIG